MRASPILRSALASVLVALCTAVFAQAQIARPAYEPAVGQEGKDVVWVPTPDALVEKMLDMAKVTPGDYVMDLGSGDGRTVIAAARRGARALGVEYNPEMVELSRQNAERAGLGARTRFIKADLFEMDLSPATVITMFLLPEINLRLRPKILSLKPGTRVVSNTFTMGEWAADESATIDDDASCAASWCTAHLWIVPARVAGTHKLAQGELTLKQEYQMLSGTLRADGRTLAVTGKVRGQDITITTGRREYTGRLNGGRLELK